MSTWSRVSLFSALLLFLGSCATTSGRLSASGTHVSDAAYSAAQQRVLAENIPSELQPYYLALYSEGEQNAVLHAMRGGMAALHLGRIDLAKSLFDLAIRRVQSLQEGAEQADRAKSKFVREQEKWFKGESYERSALYLYRGLLYLNDQDFGNAAACFKQAELNDITGDDAKGFSGDWYSAEMALALASYLNGQPQDASAALARAEKFASRQGDVPRPQPAHNRLIVVEVGRGPIKYRGGQYNEYLRFREEVPEIAQISLVGPIFRIGSAAAEDLYFQATTRGTRRIDSILAGKAQFKEDTDNAGNALITAGVVSAATGNEYGGYVGAGLALAGILTKVVSASSKPQADIREWDNLPHSIFLLPVALPRTGGSVTLNGLSGSGSLVRSLAIDVPPLDPLNKLGVLFVKW